MPHSQKNFPEEDKAPQGIIDLTRQQGGRPLKDVRSFYGTWPELPDDGFEEEVDRLRKIHRHR